MSAIHKAMVEVMKRTGPIAKDRKNQQQGYNFRGVDDVYQALQSVLAECGVYTTSDILDERTEDRTTAKGNALIYRVLKVKFTFHAAEDGSSVDSVVIGEGMDSGDKASNKAMSVAHKYALLQAFAIPTEDAKDPENQSHELKPNAIAPQEPREAAILRACVTIEELQKAWAVLPLQTKNRLTFVKEEMKAKLNGSAVTLG